MGFLTVGRNFIFMRDRLGQSGNYADGGCVRTLLLGEERDSDGEAMPLRADRVHRIVTENGMSGGEAAGAWEGGTFHLESVFL